MSLPHLPILRFGEAYRSLDVATLRDPRKGEVLAEVSLANGGLIRRDRMRQSQAAAALRALTTQQMIDISRRAGDLFLHGELPLGDGVIQSPDEYVRLLSLTSGLPHTLVRRNMVKLHYVLTHMDDVLAGLTRGLDRGVLDTGAGKQGELDLCYYPTTDALGVVLPSNSPGVNSIWLPALALRTPVVLKPGRDEPWTPLRIIRALLAAGCPREAVSLYPTDHEGGQSVLEGCGRAIIFGDDRTLKRYAGNPAIQLHGTGRSKVILGDDGADDWARCLDVMVASVADNGGRSCINASTIVTPRHGRAIAEALAARLAMIVPRPLDHPDAALAAVVNPVFADAMDQLIEAGLAQGDAEDVTARLRGNPRRTTCDGWTFLQPTVIRCDRIDHPLVNTELLFPFVTVVECPQGEVLQRIGPTLAATVITRDPGFVRQALACPDIERLNLGPTPTSVVHWDQPHEGNLFEFLYRRRALHRHPMVQPA